MGVKRRGVNTYLVLRGYHRPDLGGLVADMGVVAKLLQEFAPSLWRRSQGAGVDPMMFAVDPFLCLFSHTLTLRKGALLRAWDVLLFEGEVALFALFLALVTLILEKKGDVVAGGGGGTPSGGAGSSRPSFARWAVSSLGGGGGGGSGSSSKPHMPASGNCTEEFESDFQRLADVDINAVLVKTRAFLDTGAITREKIALLRTQVQHEAAEQAGRRNGPSSVLGAGVGATSSVS